MYTTRTRKRGLFAGPHVGITGNPIRTTGVADGNWCFLGGVLRHRKLNARQTGSAMRDVNTETRRRVFDNFSCEMLCKFHGPNAPYILHDPNTTPCNGYSVIFRIDHRHRPNTPLRTYEINVLLSFTNGHSCTTTRSTSNKEESLTFSFMPIFLWFRKGL